MSTDQLRDGKCVPTLSTRPTNENPVKENAFIKSPGIPLGPSPRCPEKDNSISNKLTRTRSHDAALHQPTPSVILSSGTTANRAAMPERTRAVSAGRPMHGGNAAIEMPRTWPRDLASENTGWFRGL